MVAAYHWSVRLREKILAELADPQVKFTISDPVARSRLKVEPEKAAQVAGPSVVQTTDPDRATKLFGDGGGKGEADTALDECA